MATDVHRTGALGAAVVMGLLLVACVQQADAAHVTGSGDDAPAAPCLGAGDEIVDPVDGDVAGTEVCEGLSGRELVEELDRAAWPGLDVADGHTGDFQELADEVGSSWEGVAMFSIEPALDDTTVVEEHRDDIVDDDVRVELVAEDGDIERAWLVTVGYGPTSGSIITSFPDEVDP